LPAGSDLEDAADPDAGAYGIWRRAGSIEAAGLGPGQVQAAIRSLEDARAAAAGPADAPPVWAAEDAAALAAVPEAVLRAGLGRAHPAGAPVSGPGGVARPAALWWTERDEESLFERWQATAAPLATRAGDAATTPFLANWAEALRPMCGATAEAFRTGQDAETERRHAAARQAERDLAAELRSEAGSRGEAAGVVPLDPEWVPPSAAYRPGRRGLWCARLPGDGIPGNPAPTRPHTFCLADGGAAALSAASLAHATCLPSRKGHKCPGPYGVSRNATVDPALLRNPAAAARFNATFVTLVGCRPDGAALHVDRISQDWWRDVVLPGGSITDADPALLAEPSGAISVLVARDPADHANLFHTMTMVQSAFSALHMAGVLNASRPTGFRRAKQHVGVVVIDTLPEGPFDAIWYRSFAPALGAIRPLDPVKPTPREDGDGKGTAAQPEDAQGDGERAAAAQPDNAEKAAASDATRDRGPAATPGVGDEASRLAARRASAGVARSLGFRHCGMLLASDPAAVESLRALSRPRRLLLPPPAYSSSMFSHVNTPIPHPALAVRSAAYRSMGLFVQQGSATARGWRADRPGDGDEVWGRLRRGGVAGGADGVCVADGADACARRAARGRVRVLVVLRRPYARFVEHSYMSRRWSDEAALAASLAKALGAGDEPGPPALPGGAEIQLLDTARLTWDQQVAALAGTDVLVGVHGAALTALLMLPPWAAVVEVKDKPDQWVCFAHLASRAGMLYQAVSARSSRKLPNKAGTAAVVDEALLASVVARMAGRAAARRLDYVRGTRGGGWGAE